jgi:hypothetical protein
MKHGKLIKSFATGKKYVCLKCGGTKTTIDYVKGGHQVMYFTKPGCRHKWDLRATGQAFPDDDYDDKKRMKK